jgi:hypothetical protein
MLIGLPGGGGGALLRTTSMGALLPPAGLGAAVAFPSRLQLPEGAASAGPAEDPAGPARGAQQLSSRSRGPAAPSTFAAGVASAAFGFFGADGVLERYWAGEADI